jgi:hypothetical protein
MKSKSFWWVAQIGVLVLAAGIGALAQTPKPVRFSGLINDYTPGTSVSPVGPWEVRGKWSLIVKGRSGKADFSAFLTMERSDYWVLTLGNPDDPSGRSPHTHTVSLVDGEVTPIDNGFRVSGTATVTASGNPPPFGSSTPLQIDITGGSVVPFSNIKLTFGSPAAGHFGSQPLDGVVKIFR